MIRRLTAVLLVGAVAWIAAPLPTQAADPVLHCIYTGKIKFPPDGSYEGGPGYITAAGTCTGNGTTYSATVTGGHYSCSRLINRYGEVTPCEEVVLNLRVSLVDAAGVATVQRERWVSNGAGYRITCHGRLRVGVGTTSRGAKVGTYSYAYRLESVLVDLT